MIWCLIGTPTAPLLIYAYFGGSFFSKEGLQDCLLGLSIEKKVFVNYGRFDTLRVRQTASLFNKRSKI